MTAARLIKELKAIGTTAKAEQAQRFFKMGEGEYGHGDQFLGVRVPMIREIAKENCDLRWAQIEKLLASRWHEARLCALHILVLRFAGARETPGLQQEEAQRQIYEFYLASTQHINNWDLVDCSAYQIVGGWLMTRSRAPLYRLARSKNLWERRIAMMATWIFIRNGQFEDTMKLAERYVNDKEDLIHKVSGWMLREVAKRDQVLVTEFLERHGQAVPRTMLRYAIERYPQAKRKRLLAGSTARRR